MTDTRIRRSVVLVVDDEPVNVALLKRLVVRAGHDARSADDGRAALAAIDADPPDLILLDIQMPGLGGFEVCRIVKTNPATRLIPIVLITGLNDRESRIEGINAGADDFLTKPFDVGELTARLRSLLRLKQYTDDLDSAESVILSLALTVEARDPYTQGHCQRLASYATTLGEALQLPVEQLAALHRGGYLHDVGKIGIPDSILLKPGALTEEEFALMKEHTTIGERLCGNLRSLISVRSIVRSHHERLDGSGYPDGLRGEEIPLLAQIVSLADIYDAITTTRPYRVASPPDYAYAEILREAERGARSMKLAELFVSLGRGGQLAAGVAASGSPVG